MTTADRPAADRPAAAPAGAAVPDAIRWLKQHPEIANLRVAVCDLNGILRGKRIPVTQVGKVLDGHLRMPPSILSCDVWGQDLAGNTVVQQTGDADALCQPTGRGILPVTWTPEPTAVLPVWMASEDGTPLAFDPRRALARVAARYRERGLTPVVATELEFYLVDAGGDRPTPPRSPVTGRPLNTDAMLSIDELDDFEAFLSDIYAACAAQDIPADAAISENGTGQFEVNLLHGPDPLKAADDAVFFKRLVRGIARKHGLIATFMAKPYGDRAGSSMHVHFSLLDSNGRNLFDDGTAAGSETLRHAIGGLLRAMPETLLVFAPHENSYRRLQPETLAPVQAAWGFENRTTAIRVPGGSPAARRLEHRVGGADANPYLVLAAVLGGALAGIEERLPPDAPVRGHAYHRNLPRLPPDWASAIDRFEQGAQAAAIFARDLRHCLVAAKRYEARIFSQQVTDFEYHSYLETV